MNHYTPQARRALQAFNYIMLSLVMFAMGGLTVRCNVDDGDDDEKAKQMQTLNHMLSEHLGEANIQAGDEPDFACQGAGLDDVKAETGFDMFFVHGCNRQ